MAFETQTQAPENARTHEHAQKLTKHKTLSKLSRLKVKYSKQSKNLFTIN